MLYGQDREERVTASEQMRVNYEHFLTPPPRSASASEGANPDFCNDIAYVLSDLYCHTTVHIPGQSIDNYLWWTALYNDLIGRISVDMPKTLTDALGVRAQVALLIATDLAADDTAGQCVARDIFVQAWIGLRAAHANIFGHTAHLVVMMRAYYGISKTEEALHGLILEMEKQLQVDMALAQKKQQEEALAFAPNLTDASILDAQQQQRQSRQVDASSAVSCETPVVAGESFEDGVLRHGDREWRNERQPVTKSRLIGERAARRTTTT